ncbi:uracil-DNA glycosylase [Hyphomicrobium sp.]|uniref:uracil-DNA glycosylase n=1 Tax=Hyphomicrobium sp. TaxID=82 RepID=UPI0025B8376B|nr:uracil-DNA glycosylase [Hyphomicrobium sp.]MCC7250643.1 uracil-DNA glycosylase [Hyphomicrobium sp.]
MQSDADIHALAATLLDWYREMGVDAAVADHAVDWLARGDVAPGAAFRLPPSSVERIPEFPPPGGEGLGAGGIPTSHVRESPPPFPLPQGGRVASPRPDPRPGFTATPPDAAELAARTVARNAASLEELETALAAFDGCGLKATAKNLCFYRGSPRARLMISGEAPGRDEDLEGKPFVGRAGQLLDKMLAAIGLKEDDVHITNVVYWRPPGNRTPTPQESQVCRPFLERQMELVEPDIVLLLGGAAAKQVLDVTEGIMRIRGKWREIDIGGRPVRTMATLHPAYLLRTPAAKRQAWRDLLAVQAALESGPAK